MGGKGFYTPGKVTERWEKSLHGLRPRWVEGHEKKPGGSKTVVQTERCRMTTRRRSGTSTPPEKSEALWEKGSGGRGVGNNGKCTWFFIVKEEEKSGTTLITE